MAHPRQARHHRQPRRQAWPQASPAERRPVVVAALDRLRGAADAVFGRSPARLALTVFALVIVLFTALLALPVSSASGQVTPLHDALFTAVSAVCVTGLTVVSTATYWSAFGQVMILVAIQVGGLGILTIASLLALAVNRRLGVRGKLIAQEGMNTGRLGEVGSLLRIVVLTTVSIEAVLALVLAPRFMMLGESPGQAIWHAVFYSISAFNNAGFTPHSDGLVPYDEDIWVLGPLMAGVFLGSLGFPVIMVLMQARLHASRWNLHTKLTLLVSGILLVGGAAVTGERQAADGSVKKAISTIIVPAGTPGFTAEPAYDKVGWNSSDTHLLVRRRLVRCQPGPPRAHQAAQAGVMETVFTAVAVGFDSIGAVVMVIGFVIAVVLGALALLRRDGGRAAFTTLRTTLGGAILLGLEVLVAADLIRTITSKPSLEDAAILGIIVLIRTVLSISIQIEIEGVLPWRRALLTSGAQVVAGEVAKARRSRSEAIP